MSKTGKITDTCIGCGSKFIAQFEEIGRYKMLVKSENIVAREVKYKCPRCGLAHKNIQAKIKKPKINGNDKS